MKVSELVKQFEAYKGVLGPDPEVKILLPGDDANYISNYKDFTTTMHDGTKLAVILLTPKE